MLSVLLFLITIDPLLKGLEAEINQREVGFRTKSKVMAFVDDINLTVALDPKSYPIMDDGTRVFVDDGRVAAYLGILEEFSKITGMRLLYCSK